MNEITLLRVMMVIFYVYKGFPDETPIQFPTLLWIYAILLELDWLTTHYIFVSSNKMDFHVKRFQYEQIQKEIESKKAQLS